MSLESTIRDHARSLGFDACRFTTSDAAPELAERLRAWLRKSEKCIKFG
jgi:epoxyqueuosine reductase QueG